MRRWIEGSIEDEPIVVNSVREGIGSLLRFTKKKTVIVVKTDLLVYVLIGLIKGRKVKFDGGSHGDMEIGTLQIVSFNTSWFGFGDSFHQGFQIFF